MEPGTKEEEEDCSDSREPTDERPSSGAIGGKGLCFVLLKGAPPIIIGGNGLAFGFPNRGDCNSESSNDTFFTMGESGLTSSPVVAVVPATELRGRTSSRQLELFEEALLVDRTAQATRLRGAGDCAGISMSSGVSDAAGCSLEALVERDSACVLSSSQPLLFDCMSPSLLVVNTLHVEESLRAMTALLMMSICISCAEGNSSSAVEDAALLWSSVSLSAGELRPLKE